ncbi:hypothetical protein ACOMHN_035699 [Nucella lapillus]
MSVTHANAEMFNNNNYLPDLNHFPPTTGHGHLPADSPLTSPAPTLDPLTPPPAMSAASGSGHVGNFRFLSPTQGTAIPTWMPTTCFMGTVSAPGTGASWQHLVPVTMPWANHVAPHFTAQNTLLPQSLPVYTTAMGVTPQTTMMQVGPKPSIRCLRLKRHYRPNSIDESDGPCSKRFLSEKMAAWFKGLQITPPSGQGSNDSDNNDRCATAATALRGGFSTPGNSWQRFQEVEKRLGENLEDQDLEMSVEKDVSNGCRASTNHRGRSRVVVLKIPEEVKKEVHSPEPVLPAQIMKTITNPCTDLVLWKPPEVIISSCLGVSSPPSHSLCSTASNRCHTSTTTTTTTSSSSRRSVGRLQQTDRNGNSSSSRMSSRSNAAQFQGASATSGGGGVVFFGSETTTRSNGSVPDMDSMEFYDCVDDDDMDL